MALTKVSFAMIEGDPINVLDYGAVGDGVTDNSAAFQAIINAVAINGSVNIYLPAGNYVIETDLVADDKFINVFGDGTSSTFITYDPATTGGVLFTLKHTVANNKSFSFKDLTITTPTANVGTAIKIQTNLTSASSQIYGATDSLYLNNVRIAQSSTGYWTKGLHSLNNGGVHLVSVSIDNRVSAAQNDAGTSGIYIQNNDIRVFMIRSLLVTDLWILRAANLIETDAVGTIESLYINMGELVGASNAIVKVRGPLSAVSFNSVHMDTTNKVLDAEGSRLGTTRMTAGDIYKTANGGSTVDGPLFILDAGEAFTFTGNHVRGSNTTSSSNLNLGFKFTNTYDGSYHFRATITGNVFVALYNVYGAVGSIVKFTCDNNSYNNISNEVYVGTLYGNEIKKYDAVIATSLIVAMDGTGTQTVNVPLVSNYFSVKYPIAFLQQASASGTDKLSIYYDFAASTSTNCAFVVLGNTVVADVRFSFLAYPVITEVTTN